MSSFILLIINKAISFNCYKINGQLLWKLRSFADRNKIFLLHNPNWILSLYSFGNLCSCIYNSTDFKLFTRLKTVPVHFLLWLFKKNDDLDVGYKRSCFHYICCFLVWRERRSSVCHWINFLHDKLRSDDRSVCLRLNFDIRPSRPLVYFGPTYKTINNE